MPTYEYACKECGQHVDVFQRVSEAPLTTCGVCGGELRKVFHPAGILFKGSGFYSTDNRTSSKKSTLSDKGESSSLSDKGESSSLSDKGESSSSSSSDPKTKTTSEKSA